MKKYTLKQIIREVITEVAAPKKLEAKLIYFVEDDELYRVKPYKLLGTGAKMSYMSMAKNWRRTTLMQGEDVRDIIGGNVTDIAAWYEVEAAPSDHTFEAYVGTD